MWDVKCTVCELVDMTCFASFWMQRSHVMCFFFRGTLQMTRDLCIFLLFSLCRWHGSLRFLGMSDNSHVICRYYMFHLGGRYLKYSPIGSMYAIYGNIYHQYTPNVSIYTIHGSYGSSIHYSTQLLAAWRLRRCLQTRPGSACWTAAGRGSWRNWRRPWFGPWLRSIFVSKTLGEIMKHHSCHIDRCFK